MSCSVMFREDEPPLFALRKRVSACLLPVANRQPVDNIVSRGLMESLCQGETEAQEEKLGAWNGSVAWTESGR